MMRLDFWFIVVLSALAIWLNEWKQLKKKPKRDRIAFFVLLIIGWGMSALDLRHLPGPTQLLLAVFKPLAWLVEH